MKTLIFKSLKSIAKLEDLGVEITFDPQEEDINVYDQYDNEDMANEVCRQYENGNRAAWFCAHVIVKFRGFEEDDYLGCCSYKSFKEFTSEKRGCYEDMISTCIDRINTGIIQANNDICRRWTIRKAKNLIAPYGLHIVSSLQINEVTI